ncbi:MAG TPA: hypothetical protein PKG98_07225 [Myxococcota bacterium]|nr:hypothetical protein [Myxococcota bacterium]
MSNPTSLTVSVNRPKTVECPFPSNHYLNPEDNSIKIASKGWNNSLLYRIEMDLDVYAKDASTVKGFALYSTLAFMTSTAVDPATLPATGAESMLPESAVRLYRLDGEVPEQQAIACDFTPYDYPDVFNMTQCRPLMKLEPDTTYLFVITDDLKDIEGNAFERSRGFMQALGLARVEQEAPAERLELMRSTGRQLADALDRGMDDWSRVTSASVFTTGHPQVDIADLLGMFRTDENADAMATKISYTLDTDNEKNPITYVGSKFPRCSQPDEEMEWGLHGTFKAPEFRNANGHFERDEYGVFKTFTGEEIPFYLMVPAGDGPFPVVLAQHGLASSENTFCEMAQELVRRDIAVLRFLWPEHGTRGNGMTDFIDVVNPKRIAYNFMQSATEIASAVILLDKLNADMTEAHPEGLGLGPLDTSRIGYVGHSLGSIIGLLYLPFSDRIDILVSNVGGLGMSHLVDAFFALQLPGMTFIGSTVVNLTDHIVAIGDGVSNAERILDGSGFGESNPKFVLAQEVIGDDVVSNASTETLARNANLKLINPVQVPIDGVESADAETLTSGLSQFVGASHHEFPGTPGSNPVADAEREQAIHYLETGLKTGTPEIIVPVVNPQ